ISAPSISAFTVGISLSACTQARTKKPMKPSFTPCFFSNKSRYCVRSAMMWPMSTSLKVVSMAAVFCASLRRRAMVWRSRVMRTRSSRAASSGGAGARICSAAAVAATGVGAAAPRSIAVSMSPLVTRPSLPEPARAAASIPDSAASLRTEGASGASGDFAITGAGFGAAAGADCGGGGDADGDAPGVTLGVARGADFAAPPPAPSLIWPSTAPTATVSPSLAAMSASTPAAGAGTSIVTLSVSSSTSGSSTATASPGCLNHLPMVASVTDSPNAGTRISAMVQSRCQMPAIEVRDHNSNAKIPVHAPTFVLAALLRQRLVQKLAKLRQVNRHLPDRGRGGGRTADIARAPVLGADLIEHPFEENVDEHPGAHIARLLLAPDHFGRFEARQLRHQRLGRKWIELLA